MNVAHWILSQKVQLPSTKTQNLPHYSNVIDQTDEILIDKRGILQRLDTQKYFPLFTDIYYKI